QGREALAAPTGDAVVTADPVDGDAERSVDGMVQRDDVADLESDDLRRREADGVEAHARLDRDRVERGLELLLPEHGILAALVLEERLTREALEHRGHRREGH